MGDRNKLGILIKKSSNNKYSLEKDGSLYWTGIVSDNWVDKKNVELWETEDDELIYVLEKLVSYSHNRGKSVKQVLLTII